MQTWSCISNICSIITLFLFIVYIIGVIWKIKTSKLLSHDEFKKEINIQRNKEEIKKCNYLCLTNSQIKGEIISISSSNGIKAIKVYQTKIKKNGKIQKGKMIKKSKCLAPLKDFYIENYFSEGIPDIYIEMYRMDYLKVKFYVSFSGRDEKLEILNYKCKFTFLCFLYYFTL